MGQESTIVITPRKPHRQETQARDKQESPMTAPDRRQQLSSLKSILGLRPCTPPHHFLAGPPAPAVVRTAFLLQEICVRRPVCFSRLVRLTDSSTLTRIVAYYLITHHGMYIIDAIIRRFFDQLLLCSRQVCCKLVRLSMEL